MYSNGDTEKGAGGAARATRVVSSCLSVAAERKKKNA